MAVKPHLFKDFASKSASVLANASSYFQEKSGSVHNVTDPTDKGQAPDPGTQPHGSRAENGLPPVPQNDKGTTPGENLTTVSDPAAVGEGQYPATVDGNAQDSKVTKATSPLKSAADNLQNLRKIREEYEKKSAARAGAAPATPASTEATNKKAADGVPGSIDEVAGLKEKLAHIGHIMMSSEYGQQAVLDTCEREKGAAEAKNFLQGVFANMQDIQKQASEQDAQLEKMAQATYTEHSRMLNTYDTFFEKQAYAGGAMDAQAELEDPAEAAEEEFSDEDILAVLAQAIESGELDPQVAQQIAAVLEGDQQDTMSPEELANQLLQAVEQGLITNEEAEALLASIAGAEEEVPAEPAGAPAGAAPEDTAKAASAGVVASVLAAQK